MKSVLLNKGVRFIATSFLVGNMAAGPVAFAGDSGPGFGQRVTGSYLGKLQLIGTDGTPLQLQALATLSADGGAVATDTDDFGFGTAAFLHSPKHGAWKKTGNASVSITILEFAFDNTGNLTTIFKLNFQAECDNDSFNAGGGSVSFAAYLPFQDPLDPETRPVATGDGTFTFQRITT